MTVDAQTIAGSLLVAFNGAALSKYTDTIFRVTDDLTKADWRVSRLLLLWGIFSALGLLASAVFLCCEAWGIEGSLRDISIGASAIGAIIPVLVLFVASLLVCFSRS